MTIRFDTTSCLGHEPEPHQVRAVLYSPAVVLQKKSFRLRVGAREVTAKYAVISERNLSQKPVGVGMVLIIWITSGRCVL